MGGTSRLSAARFVVAPDREAASELQLYIDNDYELYRQQGTPIIKNLITKKARGIYDSEKAVKLFGYLVDNGAKKYAKVFANPREWNTIFTPATRHLTARKMRDDFEAEAALGQYDNLLPKKYQN